MVNEIKIPTTIGIKYAILINIRIKPSVLVGISDINWRYTETNGTVNIKLI